MLNNSSVTWSDLNSHLLWNPATPPADLQGLQKAIYGWPAHVWLATSGSICLKWVGLAKEALLASAMAVNQYLRSDTKDHWLLTLPTFHVGGLGVEARAYLSGASLTYFPSSKWDPFLFHTLCRDNQISLSSLVPAQLFDLVMHRLVSPPSLRTVLVGGGHLSPIVYQKATHLGWPILPTYGLTECSSQVATAPLMSWQEATIPPFMPLPHLQIQSRDGILHFQGPSLLTGYFIEKGGAFSFCDPKQNGWFASEDRGEVIDGKLILHGRSLDFWKIGGENVSLSALESLLDQIRMEFNYMADVALVPIPDDRLGHIIALATTPVAPTLLQDLIHAFQKRTPPFARIRKVYQLISLPRSPLHKLRLSNLQTHLKQALEE